MYGIKRNVSCLHVTSKSNCWHKMKTATLLIAAVVIRGITSTWIAYFIANSPLWASKPGQSLVDAFNLGRAFEVQLWMFLCVGETFAIVPLLQGVWPWVIVLCTIHNAYVGAACNAHLTNDTRPGNIEKHNVSVGNKGGSFWRRGTDDGWDSEHNSFIANHKLCSRFFAVGIHVSLTCPPRTCDVCLIHYM